MILLIVVVAGLQLENLRERIDNGKLHYEVYTTGGNCWENAVNSMTPTCSEMDEHTQSLFATKLTNCHLKRLGLKEITCKIGDCDLDNNSFIAYTHFFTHSFDICVYISYTAWQTKTQNTIQALNTAADLSLKALDASQTLAQQISDKQEDVQASVLRSISLHQELQAQLSQSRDEMKDFAIDFMNSSKKFQDEMNKQQEFLSKWFTKLYSSILEIGYIQETILGEIWDINSILFYFTFITFFIFFTSFPETYSVRFKVFWLLLLEVVIEKYYKEYYRLQRIGLFGGCLALVLFSAHSYKQYDRLSYDLLRNFLLKVGNKALVAFTPNGHSKSLPSPLKQQCLNRLKKIHEIHPDLEEDVVRSWRKPSDSELSRVFKALSEKKIKKKISDIL
jgi:hypothetical protein